MTPAADPPAAPQSGHRIHAVREFPGRANQIPVVRRFVLDTLGGCPASDDAVLLASELATNAVIHSASGLGGGFRVALTHQVGDILLAVSDQGGPWRAGNCDRAGRASHDEAGGHGLVIVGALTHAWGVTGDDSGRVVWAVLACPAATTAEAAITLTNALFRLGHSAPEAEVPATPPPHRVHAMVARYDGAITECAGDNRMPGPEDRVAEADAPTETPVARDDLQQRLERLPLGHPSSPLNDNGTRKPPPPRPQELPLPDDLPDTDSRSLVNETHEVGDRLSQARAQGLDTRERYTRDPDGELWAKERRPDHNAIIESLYAHATDVPNDRQAIIAGGLPGAGKTTILEAYAGIERARYFTIDPDQIKEEMAQRDLIPKVDGLSPMEASDLVHAESSHIARRLAHRAKADGKNLIWDISMKSAGGTERRIDDLRSAGYAHIEGIFVEIPVDTSISRADARHKSGQEEYHEGKGYGGRYMPSELIGKQADAEWGSLNRKNFEMIKGRFDRWSIFDNSVDGRAPELVDSSDVDRRSP